MHAADLPAPPVPDPEGSYLSFAGLPTANRQRSTLELTTRRQPARLEPERTVVALTDRYETGR